MKGFEKVCKRFFGPGPPRKPKNGFLENLSERFLKNLLNVVHKGLVKV